MKLPDAGGDKKQPRSSPGAEHEEEGLEWTVRAEDELYAYYACPSFSKSPESLRLERMQLAKSGSYQWPGKSAAAAPAARGGAEEGPLSQKERRPPEKALVQELQGSLLRKLGEVGQTLDSQLQEHFQRQELLIHQQTLRLEAALGAARSPRRISRNLPDWNNVGADFGSTGASPDVSPTYDQLAAVSQVVSKSTTVRKERSARAMQPCVSTTSSPVEMSQGISSKWFPEHISEGCTVMAPTMIERSLSGGCGSDPYTSRGTNAAVTPICMDVKSPRPRPSATEQDTVINTPCHTLDKEETPNRVPSISKFVLPGDASGWSPTFIKDRAYSFRADDVKLKLGENTVKKFAKLLEWWFNISETTEPERTSWLARFVSGKWFEVITTFVILINSIATVRTTNYEAKYLKEDTSAATRIMNVGFVLFYGLELFLRLMVHRVFFFCNHDFVWNLFDLVLVSFAFCELFFSEAFLQDTVNVAHMRTIRISLRILRTAKTLRMMRVIRFFSELRLLMNSVLGSLPSLFWSIVMLVFMFFIFALIFVQGSTLEMIQNNATLSPDAYEVLHTHLGSTQHAMLMLFKSTTGGDDWANYFWAISETGWGNCALFLFFIAFAQIALLNILTGIFVENAMKIAEPDRDAEALHQRKKELEDAEDLRKLCRLVDTNRTGYISEAAFMEKLKSSQFRARLGLLGLDIKDAALFFQVVSAGYENPEVEIEAFVSGAMRLKGNASSLDLQALMFRTRMIYGNQMKILHAIEQLSGCQPLELPLPQPS